MKTTQHLFAYGTFNDHDIQHQIFGRRLKGKRDVLVGYKLTEHKTLPHYQVAKRTDTYTDRIVGRVYHVANVDLFHADEYESESKAYKRVQVALQSGIEAWVFTENHKLNGPS